MRAERIGRRASETSAWLWRLFVRGIPLLLFLDEQHVVTKVIFGPPTDEDLAAFTPGGDAM